MGLRRLTPEEVTVAAVETLGLDSEIADFDTPEVLAAALRRAASFICPASPRRLIQVVEGSLRGLLPIGRGSQPPVGAMLEDLVAYGDLIEAPVEDQEQGVPHRTLFLGPPTYVRASATCCLLLGVPADGIALLEEALAERIEYDLHVRRIHLFPGEDPGLILASAGLRELNLDQWLKHPRECLADALLSEYDAQLVGAEPSGAIWGCRILDPSKSTLSYGSRWRAPTCRDSGRFVARRPLEFGPDAWCYAELAEGKVRTLVDLPTRHRMDRACDEAWRLQAAIDWLAGNPQMVQVEHQPGSTVAVLNMLSPIPSWAQRRLSTFGRTLPRKRGILISYQIDEEMLEEELTFLRQILWTECDYEGGKDED